MKYTFSFLRTGFFLKIFFPLFIVNTIICDWPISLYDLKIVCIIMLLCFISVSLSISFCSCTGKELRVAGQVTGYMLDISWQGQNSELISPSFFMWARSHWPRLCCPPQLFNSLCTFLDVCENKYDIEGSCWVIIQFFMCVTSLLSSMPFIL